MTWLILIVVPGMREPMYLAHSGKTHGLLHGEIVVVVQTGVAGVGLGYFGIPS